MEIVDLSIDPELKMENAKQVRKMFNELKKYVPFLQFIFDLDPIQNSKYKPLINWLKIRNNTTIDRWHVVSCETTIKKRYEKLKNTTNFPSHIKEIFEGGIPIVISDEEDSTQPSASVNFKREGNLKNYTQSQIKNSINKQQSSPSSIPISQRREGDIAQEESRNEKSTSGNSEKSFDAKQKTKLQTSSKISLKRRSSKYHKNSRKEKKEANTINVDTRVLDIVSWNDLEEEDDKISVSKNLLFKEPSSRSYPMLSKKYKKTESDERKKNYKQRPKNVSKNSSEIEHKSYKSLIKQRKKLKKLLMDEGKKAKPKSNIDNSTLEKPQQIELFQRESTMSERKKSFVDPSIIASVKYVLDKNPDIVAEVVNNNLETKIVYDYTNVKKTITSKTVPFTNIVTNKSKSNILQLQTEIRDLKVNDGVTTRNINVIESITSETPENNNNNNNCTEGDEYRKAMYEQQLKLQYQDKIQQPPRQNLEGPLLHHQNKISYNSSVLKKSSISNKKSQNISASTQPSSNANLNTKTYGDHRRTSNQSQSNDFDMNKKKFNSSETREKSTDIKTKQKINCPKTFETISNSSESEQRQKEGDDVVLMSLAGRRKIEHRIESVSSLENFELEKINFASGIHSSSFEKVKRKNVKSKAEEILNQSSPPSNSMKRLPGKSKDCASKPSKSEPTSVNHSKKISTSILFKKDEARKSSEHKTIKPKHDSVSDKPKSTDKSSKHDHKSTKPKTDSGVDQVIDLKSKEQKCKYESRKNDDDGVQTKKRKHSVNQDHDFCSQQKLLKIDNTSKKSDSEITYNCTHIHQENKSEQGKKTKNSFYKSTDKTIKVKEHSDSIQKNSKRKSSRESIEKIKKRPEKKTKISTPSDKQLVVTAKNIINSPVRGFEEVSKLTEDKTKDSSSIKTNNTPSKKSISTHPNNNSTPKKATSSPSRRFYRELNNLSCTFKESLLPQTIKRRRCSSSWFNLSEDVNQKLKSASADLKPAPIQRRRQTCSAMPLLKLTLQRSSNNEYCIKGIENDRSSDETDEFDIDDLPKINKKIPNPDVNERVVESNANKRLKTMDSPYKEMSRLISFDSIDSQTHTRPPGNNDCKMTFKSTKTCVLCNKNSKDLTNHYVVKHKTESYVSRLSSTDIRKLEKEKTVAIPVFRDRYRITCVFCKQMVEDHFENFYAHFSFHTGEYNYQCEGCKIKKPYKEDIGSHQLRSRVCMNSKINKIHHNELETTIYLHICKICNFVNLNEINLKNHLREQHGYASDELKSSKRCILLVKDVQKIVKEHHPAGYAGNNCKADNTPVDVDSPLCAEKDFICELSMDIQNILMDEGNLATGHESDVKNKHDVPKIITGQQIDLTVESDRDKIIASSLSPEELLEEMHAPNNTKNTIAESVLGESTCKSREISTTKNISRIVTSGEASSENLNSIFTAALNSKKQKIHDEVDVEKKNASGSSFVVKKLDTSLSPEELLEEMHAPNSAKNTIAESVLGESSCNSHEILATNNLNRNVTSGEASSQNLSNTFTAVPNSKIQKIHDELVVENKNSSFVVKKLDTIPTLRSSNENSSKDLHELESLSNIEESIKSTEEKFCPDSKAQIRVINNSSKETCYSPAKINLEKLRSSKSLRNESRQCIIEDPHDSESLGSIEAYIKSTNEIPFPDSETHLVKIHDSNSMVIVNSLKENLCKSPERHLDKPSACKSSNKSIGKLVDELHASAHPLIEITTHSLLDSKILPQSSVEPGIDSSSPQYKQSIIYRQYNKFDPNNFGLFKCLIEDCLYTTNSDVEFKTHWSNHNKTKILDCPYCTTKSSCLENCIHHIWNEHSMSNYQCVKCSYRSIIPGNIKIHSRICHQDSKADESIYKKCGYVKISKETKYKAIPKKPRDNVASLKCPDCPNSFFSKASIKSHLKKSHPLNYQRLSSLNVNELACLHCKLKSNCKEMQIHLALQHPDEPGFVIGRKLKSEECEDGVEDLMVVDICIDVLETDIKNLDESENLSIADLNEDQEAMDTLETEPKQLETVINTQVSAIATVMPLDSPTKSCRSPGSCTINHQPEESSEASSTNNRTKSPLREKKCSSTELKKMDETQQTKENCLANLTESDVVYSENCKMQQNDQSQTLHDIVHKEGVANNLHIQSPNESFEVVQPMLIDNIQLDHLQHERLEVPFEPSSDNFSEAVVKEGERISSLLELLVENTGVHSSALYKCPHCDSSFRHFELWITHMEKKHKNIQDVHCPYCTKQLQLETAEAHFKYHLRHKYVCYYCIASCCSKEKIQEHFASCHDTCTTIEWPIASFYLVIKQDAIISDYTALLEHFSEAIYLHLTKKIQQNTVNEWAADLTDTCLDEMEIPQYKPNGQSLFKCFEKLCPFVASNENSFDDHLLNHKLPKTFECKYCLFHIIYPSWESIKCHHLQHLSPSLHVCCVCKFVHFSNEGMIKHIENLHNSRDVPVLCLLRDGLNYKVSLSVFLPPNKISFSTSKACFCCTEELRNSNNYLNHLKKVHKLSLCLRCQLCSKIILTPLDAEAHFKVYHQNESFKLKYEISTTYLYNLILTSRSPLTMEIRLKKEKYCNQQIESNSNESSSIAVKEEILIKDELKEDKQTESISINCLHTNQLLENHSESEDNTFRQHPRQCNDIDVNSIQMPQTYSVNHDVQHPLGDMITKNTSRPGEPQNSASFTQHQQLTKEPATSPQQHVQPSTNIRHFLPLRNTVLQYSSQKQVTSREVPLLPQIAVPHSTPTTSARCFSPSATYSHALLSSQSQNEESTLPNPERDSLPSTQTQHVVIKNIQLTTGNAILSIPLEASTAEKARIEEESQSIPVITTRVAQPNIQQIPAPPQSISSVPNMQTYTRPLSNTIAQASQINKPYIDEIAPICGTCDIECINFIHLQSHYEKTHAINNQGFYFYVDRKISCMYCCFEGSVSSLAQHHATFHLGRKKLCRSILDPIRCGICNGIFRYPSSFSASNYSLPPLCVCPGHKRVLADCLTLPILKTLQNIGYQYYKYSCDICKLQFQSPQQLVHHYYYAHNQYIDPQVWKARLKYYCCMCASKISYSIFDIIDHMRFSHLITMGLTLFQRFEFYKRIRIAYPNGLLVSLDDLRNTGQFNAEVFKEKIYNYEAQYTKVLIASTQ